MEFVQDLLTFSIQAIAFAGFAGIVLHAILSQHSHFMASYCPQVADYTPKSRAALTTHSRAHIPAPIQAKQRGLGRECSTKHGQLVELDWGNFSAVMDA
jgi:hypothetical protein